MNSERIDVECPECDRPFKVTMQDVIRGRSVRCPSGHSFQLEDEGGEIAKMERELRNIDKDFRF